MACKAKRLLSSRVSLMKFSQECSLMLEVIALAQRSYLKSALKLSRLTYWSPSRLVMLKPLGLHGAGSLIKSGEVTTPPMLQSGTDSETRQQHSPGSLHSAFSPSSQLSSRASPPIRQPLYADAYSEPLRPLNLQSYNSLVSKMESLPESTKTFSADGRPSTLGDKLESRTWMVVVDASQKLTLAALKLALQQYVNPGDRLYLLGVLHQIFNPMGYKQKADATGTKFGGINQIKLQNELERKHDEYETAIADQEVQKLFTLKQVTPKVVIGTGPVRKEVTKHWAEQLSATWVILDKNLKKDIAYLKENLNCNILMMKANGEAYGVCVYQDKSDTFQDNMIDQMSEEFDARVGINDTISLSVNAARHSSISPPRPSESTMTQSRSEWESPPHYQDHYSLLVDSDREPKSELGPGSLEGSPDRSCPLPEDDKRPAVLSSTEMPIDLAENLLQPAAGFYQKPIRAVSTGDLRSLPLIRTASGVYRPAARSANDRAGDELMSILNPPSTEAPTVKGVRTLKTSFREDDPTYEEPSPINNGRMSKFGDPNGDNRFSADNSSSRKKMQPRVAPLCSVCNYPGPGFGRDARQFSYAQLEQATNNFDQDNYLAEGGYGFVYRGRLEGGQEIAVKQYKAASSQGDDEFYSEVEVLKHAQHRNLVILVGYCIEEERRLLVYEFVCNKSLDVHLSAKNPNVLKWEARWKIAVGAARGLRYLHEECRVGCIVHRDMRPNNILLTHDFVPMVGDFGLARSQPVGDEAEETRVIGTLGYLAPEYAESGTLTEKADVYSFGVVLLELITGRKAIDATKPRGETCLTEWARPLISNNKTTEIVDTRLKGFYDENQVIKMVYAAGKCIQKDKDERPKMSDVLRILERDENTVDPISRAQSFNELINEVPPNPPKRAISSDSLIHTKSNVAPIVTTPLSTHREDYNTQSEKQVKKDRKAKDIFGPNVQRMASSRKKLPLVASLSPGGKHPLRSSPSTTRRTSSRRTPLSYDQML